jgi:hypothetical protein
LDLVTSRQRCESVGSSSVLCRPIVEDRPTAPLVGGFWTGAPAT